MARVRRSKVPSSFGQCNSAQTDVATEILKILKSGGSTEHAAGVQWFFKDAIQSHGWYTADLRQAMRRCRQEILHEHEFDFLLAVADKLFRESVLEEKICGVSAGEDECAVYRSRVPYVRGVAGPHQQLGRS
jgi:DNA alkylation repair enzyme